MDIAMIVFAIIGALCIIVVFLSILGVWLQNKRDEKIRLHNQEIEEAIWYRINSFVKEFHGVDKAVYNLLIGMRDKQFADDLRIAYEKEKKATNSKTKRK